MKRLLILALLLGSLVLPEHRSLASITVTCHQPRVPPTPPGARRTTSARRNSVSRTTRLRPSPLPPVGTEGEGEGEGGEFCANGGLARGSLPLDRRGRLRADVVDDAVDAGHLVDDAAADPGQHVVRQPRPVGGHPVVAGHRADGDHVGVGPAVAHHADRADRRQDREGLPQGPIQPGALDLVDHDPVRLAQRLEPLGGHLADDPDREARARERLALDHRLRQAQLLADLAHLVLEQVAQRLDQLEAQVRRQAADVVVGLDLGRDVFVSAVFDSITSG